MSQFLPLFLNLTAQEDQVTMIGSVIGGLLGSVFGIIVLIAMWKVFTKAGKPGWAVLIPFYNLYVLLEIVGRPGWWLLMFLIPIVNVIFLVTVNFDLAKSFGKGTGFGLGLIFLTPIFILILGFGSAQYIGPVSVS
jgi:hypothetical protein